MKIPMRRMITRPNGRWQLSCKDFPARLLLQSQSFDPVILDLMLPGWEGLEILKTLRERGVETPVLALTARGCPDTGRIKPIDAIKVMKINYGALAVKMQEIQPLLKEWGGL
jgi:DNA-binding NtrC family response regulator